MSLSFLGGNASGTFIGSYVLVVAWRWGEDQSESLQKRVHKSVNAARKSAYATSRHQENQRVAVSPRKLSDIGLAACGRFSIGLPGRRVRFVGQVGNLPHMPNSHWRAPIQAVL